MKKLLFILFCIAPMYAMQKEQSSLLNIAFRNAVGDATLNTSQENFDKIKEYLKLGADINYTAGILYGEAAIIDAVRNFNKELFDFLLQNNADINSCDNNKRTPLHLFIQKRAYQSDLTIEKFGKFDIEKDFLQQGADPNINADLGYPALTLAINHKNTDLVKLLLKYNAKINEKDRFNWTPLDWAIDCHNFEVIEELCHRGASLVDIDNSNSNAFHVAIQRKLIKNSINLFVTNSRFDVYNKEVDEQLKTTIKTALLIFSKLKPTLPQEIQLIIFSHLALNCLYDSFNKKLCQVIVGNKNAKNSLLTYTLDKVNCLEQILQSKNNQNKTALQTLHDEYKGDWYIQEIESLVDVKKLQQDRNDFMNGSVQEDNLVVQIYEHGKKLLES